MSHYEPITIEEFKEAMPIHIRKNICPELVDQVNSVIADPEIEAVFRENVIGLSTVMREGKFKLDSYLHAVKFVSHKLLGDTHIAAWAKTFPGQYNKMTKRGSSRSEVASIASRYASSKLVILLMGQTMVPTHILNAPLYQQAINVQAELMMSAKSEKVRCDAASNLTNLLKPPETKKIELDIGVKEDQTIQELRETTMALARQQRMMIEGGQASVRAIAESKLIAEEAQVSNG
jgi:hypothetical protein